MDHKRSNTGSIKNIRKSGGRIKAILSPDIPKKTRPSDWKIIMKRVASILFCILFISQAACIRDDRSHCPSPVNAYLTFSYTGDTNEPEMFAQMIDHVTLMAFGEDGKRVVSSTINKSELERLQGTELFLEPGNYRIICWGNADEHTEMTACEDFTTGRLHHPDFLTDADIPTNSHLYHGTYTLSVPSDGIVTGDIPFRAAHINVEVYIRGASIKEHSIQAHQLMPQYNLEMADNQPFETTYYPQSVYNEERMLEECLFQVLRFSDDNPVVIEIRQPSGDILAIDLKQYMAENKITVNGKNEATVPVLVEYNDLGVVLKIPEWLVHDVTPGV